MVSSKTLFIIVHSEKQLIEHFDPVLTPLALSLRNYACLTRTLFWHVKRMCPFIFLILLIIRCLKRKTNAALHNERTTNYKKVIKNCIVGVGAKKITD